MLLNDRFFLVLLLSLLFTFLVPFVLSNIHLKKEKSVPASSITILLKKHKLPTNRTFYQLSSILKILLTLLTLSILKNFTNFTNFINPKKFIDIIDIIDIISSGI